jgi:hypothetical protein
MTRSGPGLETADRAGSCCLGTQKLDDLGSLRGFVRNEFAKPQWACPQPVCPLNRQRRPRCSRSTNPNLRAGFRQLGHPSNACDRHRGARPGPGANKRDGSSAIIDLKAISERKAITAETAPSQKYGFVSLLRPATSPRRHLAGVLGGSVLVLFWR